MLCALKHQTHAVVVACSFMSVKAMHCSNFFRNYVRKMRLEDTDEIMSSGSEMGKRTVYTKTRPAGRLRRGRPAANSFAYLQELSYRKQIARQLHKH